MKIKKNGELKLLVARDGQPTLSPEYVLCCLGHATGVLL